MIQFCRFFLQDLSRLPLLCCGLLLFAVFSVKADHQALRYHSLADDFINAPVTSFALTQDRQGFIWMANQLDGLQRFDGYQLNEFAFAQGPAAVAQHSISVSALQVDRHNRVWVGSWGQGLGMWSADRKHFSRWPAIEPQLPAPGFLSRSQAGSETGYQTASQILNTSLHQPRGNTLQIQALFADRQHRLWVGSTAGLYYLDSQDQVQQLRPDIHRRLSTVRFWQISQGLDGTLWFATSEGLFQLNQDLTDIKLWSSAAMLPLDTNPRTTEVRTVLPVQDAVWFATSEGLFLLDLKKQHVRPLKSAELALARIHKLNQLQDASILIGSGNGLYQLKAPFSYRQQIDKLMDALDVRDMLQDHNGLIWVSSRNRGVYNVQLAPRKFSLLLDSQGHNWFAPGQHRIASQLYHQGTLWLGLEHEVVSFQTEQQQWQKHSFPAKSQVKLVQGLAIDSTGKVWAGTDKGLFRLEGKKGFVPDETPFAAHPQLQQRSIMALNFHTDGKMSLALWEQGLLRWSPDEPELPAQHYKIATGIGNAILQIAAGGDEVLWLTSTNNGLYRLDLRDDSIRHFSTAADSVPRLPSPYLPCVWSMSANQAWLCSDVGLLRLDLVTNQLQQFGTAAGLPDPRVIAIAAQPGQPLWLVTRRGLAELNSDTGQVRSYTDLDGVAPLLLEQRALSPDANGRFYLGSGQGVLSFQPRKLTGQSSTAPLVLSRVQIDQQTLWQVQNNEVRPLRIPAGTKQLQFQFSLLDFQQYRHHQYRYRLLGLDDNWQHNGHQHRVSFSNLAPGHYSLEVEVTGSRQSTAPLRVMFEVERHWWQYKLLWLFAALFLLVVTAALVRFRLNQLGRKAHKLNQLVAKRTADLASANKQLASQARTDYLTRLPNRLAFHEQYQTVLHHSQRANAPLCLVLIDIDFFKQINDNFGHDAGDLVLRSVAEQLQQRLRQQDVLARYGGEEFILLLPDTAIAGAQIICETLRLALQHLQVDYQQQHLSVTATFGVVELNEAHNDLSYWQQKADKALYFGKKNGRDQVVLYPDIAHS